MTDTGNKLDDESHTSLGENPSDMSPRNFKKVSGIPRIPNEEPIIIRANIPTPEITPAIANQFSSRPSVNSRIRAICNMSAMGMKNNRIAESMGMSDSRISIILSAQSSKDYVRQVQTEMFTNEPSVVFKTMAPAAVRTIQKVMMNKDEKGSTRIAAASIILDRAYGKPTQEIKHEGMGVADLFKAMDDAKKEMRATKAVDAEWSEIPSDISPSVIDPLEAFVEGIEP